MARSAKTRARGGILAGLLLLLCLLVALSLRHSLESGFPETLSLTGDHPPGVTRVLAADGQLVATLFLDSRKPLPRESLGDNVIEALLSVEDHRFHQHSGVDWRAVARAATRNAWAGQVEEGASTLSMQLARHLYLDKERSWRRKAQEALLAWRLEETFSKEAILTAYLNEMYFGGGAYGVGAASSRLFGKTPDQLSVAQSALLVGLLQSPSHLNPALNPEGARARQEEVLARMRDLGKLSLAEYRRALAEPMRFDHLPAREMPMLKFPYFTTYAISSVAREIGEDRLYREALTISTTLDIEAQRLVEKVLSRALREEGQAAGVDTGAIVVISNETGSVRAMAGGAGWSPKDQFNRAWQARRQAGSSFKPFLYAVALENGYQPFTQILDAPLSLGEKGGWIPANSDGRALGMLPLRQALAFSRNQATARLMSDLGPHLMTDLCGRFGIVNDLPQVPSLALGSGTVTPLEMATAYSVFANEGWLVESHAVVEATTASGQRLVDHRFPWITQSTSPAVATQMTDLLLGAVAHGTGRAAAIEGLSVAGKTGTTDAFRDAWFVGFTPSYTVAVWLGNDDNSPTAGLYGGALPARLFRQVSLGLEQPSRTFPFLHREPAYLTLCSLGHTLAGPHCTGVYGASTYLPTSGTLAKCRSCRPPVTVQVVLNESSDEAFPSTYAYDFR